MELAYHETLPEDYFDDLYAKTVKNLLEGENVCISVIPGCGARTIFNFLKTLVLKHKIFKNIFVYDPEFGEQDLIKSIKAELVKVDLENLLVIIPSFEFILNKNDILSKFDVLKRICNRKLVFLTVTDHSAITENSDYTTRKSIFFSEVIYVPPFDLKQTLEMIETISHYYGWKVPEQLKRRIYQLSGGVPRLIKYLCKEYSETNVDLRDIHSLVLIHQVNFQLHILAKILISCPNKVLDFLGLTRNGEVKSLLLRSYFKSYISDEVKEFFPNLSKNEARILSYLLENKKNFISLDRLANVMKMVDDNFSLWAIYKQISRLKSKVKNIFLVKNLKGLGYTLERVKP